MKWNENDSSRENDVNFKFYNIFIVKLKTNSNMIKYYQLHTLGE